ncbi:MAG: LysM peptidoglycan-binding domain-containing protein [Bacteroidetes bacterium]|nr:MAG: LysM peptidoglycan-binding domain-containing protein [Bacteroidota bacterium]
MALVTQLKRMKKENILIFLFCLLGSWGLAQPENPTTEVINGKKYYVHIVQGGNTLYGLSRVYKTDAAKIVEANPFVEQGLKIGQKVLIPFMEEGENISKTQKPKDSIIRKDVPMGDTVHVVQKSETLYGISRMYGLKMEDLVRVNPGIENGIQIGQQLKLPKTARKSDSLGEPKIKTEVSFSDSVIQHEVLPHETLYSISKRFMVPIEEIRELNEMRNNRIRKGDLIKIPVKKETIKKIEVRQIVENPFSTGQADSLDSIQPVRVKDVYEILYLLPFQLEGRSNVLSDISTDFFMGSRLALDSLEKLGLKARVRVIDATINGAELQKLLDSDTLISTDLVIGPFLGTNVELVANWCKQKGVRMVSPLFSSTEILKKNPYVYNAVNSDISLIEDLAEHLSANKEVKRVILVKVGEKDNDLYQAFRQKFIEKSSSKPGLSLVESSVADIGNYFSRSENTILVAPSRELSLATQLINQINRVKHKAKHDGIYIYTTKDWMNSDHIKGFYKNKFHFHCASPYDLNYTYDSTKKVVKDYRIRYNADLSKFSSQGFDVSLCFISYFFLEEVRHQGIMNELNLVQVSELSGYENRTSYILGQEEFMLKRIDVIGGKK